jgi:hypothetical protein
MGKVRKQFLQPGDEEVTYEKRGFSTTDAVAQAHLEHVATQFLVGLGYGLEYDAVGDVAGHLEDVERSYRGFAYEGAAMGLAVADAMSPLGGHRIPEFLEGPGRPHVYMVHVGIGWAMARLPRLLWGRAVAPDPVLQWLALDGFGFHQAFFKTERYVHRHERQHVVPPWPDPSGYAGRGLDQGIGRAMWFVHGANVDVVAASIAEFAPERHDDLWSGIGLAATYAGGVDGADLERLRKLSQQHCWALAQGSAFAGQARKRAGLVVPHTHVAVETLCGTDLDSAAAATDLAGLDLPADTAQEPAFETWRRRIQQRLAEIAG